MAWEPWSGRREVAGWTVYNLGEATGREAYAPGSVVQADLLTPGELTLRARGGVSFSRIPVEVVAELMRLEGWTVVPPGEKR